MGINIAKVKSTAFDRLFRRITKVLRYGKDDSQTGLEAEPYGIDSNPIAGMDAIYAETSDIGRKVIIGYIGKDKLAAIGETRLYSTDEDGELKFFVWLKNDGTLQLGGNTKHLARFEELETGFNALKADFNTFLTHVH